MPKSMHCLPESGSTASMSAPRWPGDNLKTLAVPLQADLMAWMMHALSSGSSMETSCGISTTLESRARCHLRVLRTTKQLGKRSAKVMSILGLYLGPGHLLWATLKKL